jgi:DNA-binding GntR family transcriptional regulator
MTTTGPARNRDRISRTYERLRELIVAGRLAPGSRLVESAVAERLGTSRTPVRSAFHRLQQEGYVVATGGGKLRMMTVAPLTQEDGREVFWIVGELEGVAAHWAAELPPADRETLTAELAWINEALRAAAGGRPPDPAGIFDLHTRFHVCYVDGCSGPRLRAMHRAVKPQADRYRRLYSTALGADIHASIAEHEVIIRAIHRGDPAGAEAAVKANWRNAAVRLAKLIEQRGERGSW